MNITHQRIKEKYSFRYKMNITHQRIKEKYSMSMHIVRSLENREKLVRYLLDKYKKGLYESHKDCFRSATFAVYKTKKKNPLSKVYLLMGVIQNEEVEHCWYSIDGVEKETFNNKFIELREKYQKIVKFEINENLLLGQKSENRVEKLLSLVKDIKRIDEEVK